MFLGEPGARLWPKGWSQERAGGGGNTAGSQEQMLETSRSLSFLSSEFPAFSPTTCLLGRGLSASSAAEDIVHPSLIYVTRRVFLFISNVFQWRE